MIINIFIMPDILHQFNIKASTQEVFDAFCTPTRLDNWWTAFQRGNQKKAKYTRSGSARNAIGVRKS